MKTPIIIICILILALNVAGCATQPLAATAAALPAAPAVEKTVSAVQTAPAQSIGAPVYLDPKASTAERVEDLLGRMTLEEKIGQMTQVEKDSIQPGDITRLYIGSILSGGGGSPSTNTPEAWVEMVDGFQKEALKTRLHIPLIYGVDAIHGHNNLQGATIFPHNVGLGAANDPKLMEEIGRATAEEMSATGARWNFAPVVAVPQDIRWGRTYEGYSQFPEIVSSLAAAYIRGQQNAAPGGLRQPPSVLTTAKHYIGDGGTKWGTSTTGDYKIDRGDMQVDEATLRSLYLAPYQVAIETGAESVMVSFSSWNGTKMHANKQLVTDVLKNELGFKGFVVSDWQGIEQIPGNGYSDVVKSINAGLDMIMVPYDYKTFISDLTRAVNKGDVSKERIDDAVRRILTAKFDLGLFETPYADPALLDTVGSDVHRALARQAVQKSLVLLQNENQALPLPKDAPVIFVGGKGGNNIGMQCGGWTMEWQGKMGDITPGTTILNGVETATGGKSQVVYDPNGAFADQNGADGKPLVADIGIVVVGETPYAEGQGDRADLSLSAADQELINSMRARSKKLVVVILSGRPMIITNLLPKADAWVAAWLPGTEGNGITDVLFGDAPFTGKLAYIWPRSMDQVPASTGTKDPLFPAVYGLSD